MRHAKIVCTLGPATCEYDVIRQLIEAGMDAARLNFSHGDHQSHRQTYDTLREAANDVGKPVAVIADLCGPKIRIGNIEGGQATVQSGDSITITTRNVSGSARLVGTNYDKLAEDVAPGVRILIDDGLLRFIVERIDGDDIHCIIEAGGTLQSRKGMNIPEAHLSTPALTEKDEQDIAFGLQLGVDYFALSFVRTSVDVLQAKALAGDIPVIAKIEKPQAVDDLDSIADAADGLMVARGDLAVEAGPEKVPLLQKRMIREMNQRAKPVITATQMLESMVTNPVPTRAEVSDVANAVLDGTDAVMLSAETAAGKYPVEAVRTMARIVLEVEETGFATGIVTPPVKVVQPNFRNGIAHSAARCAILLDLSAVAVYSQTGRSVALVSAYRPHTSIVAFIRHEQMLPRLSLYWGVTPVHIDWVHSSDEAVITAERILLEQGVAKPGDEIAVTFGKDEVENLGTSIMRLWKIRQPPQM